MAVETLAPSPFVTAAERIFDAGVRESCCRASIFGSAINLAMNSCELNENAHLGDYIFWNDVHNFGLGTLAFWRETMLALVNGKA